MRGLMNGLDVTTFISALWAIVTEMAPYLLFGFFMAGLLSVIISPERIEKELGKKGFMSVLKASLFGVPLPLCSCSVIPVAASLRRHGASKGAVSAFMLSTPQTGVDSILVTFSLLGPVFAIIRPIAAFLSGLAGGALTIWHAGKAEKAQQPTVTSVEKGCCCSGSGCTAQSRNRGWIARSFNHGFIEIPQDIGKSLVIGILVAGAISVLVPSDFVSSYLGGGVGSMLLMMIFGIPLYVCATASVPVAAALMAKGVSPGAALVFLMTGPATNSATIAALHHLLGRRSSISYLVTVAGTAIATGLAVDYVFRLQPTGMIASGGSAEAGLFKTVSAIVLIGVLLFANIHKLMKR